MLAKRLSWVDFNGNKREQTFYFGLDETDLANYQMSHNGGMTEMLQGMIDAQDNANLAKKFEELILMCYGEKSDDGMYFMKSPEISHKFRCTGAYNTLFLEFLKGGEQYTADFINAVIPADLAQQIAAEKGVEGPTLVKE
jgi:hypothetical protein